eukprot:6438223-Amphidinium_carterae.1
MGCRNQKSKGGKGYSNKGKGKNGKGKKAGTGKRGGKGKKAGAGHGLDWSDDDEETFFAQPQNKKHKGAEGVARKSPERQGTETDKEDRQFFAPPAKGEVNEDLVFKIRRPLRTSPNGNFIFSESDPVDKMTLQRPYPTIGGATRAILTAMNLDADVVMQDVKVRGIRFTKDKQKVSSFAIHLDDPASVATEVVLVRKGG